MKTRTRNLRLAGLFSIVAIAGTLAHQAVQADHDKKDKSPRITALPILESYTVEAPELSGLAWRKNPSNQRRELVLVSDRDFEVRLIDWEKRETEFSVRSVDLRPLLLKAKALLPQSQWEAVFADESGRLFIVQETPAAVIVVSAALDRIEARIALASDSEPAGNSGNEGILPLSNGHILALKEKNPLRVIEYGPEGDAPKGYRPDLALGDRSGRFPLPAGSKLEFQPLMNWKLKGDEELLIEDSSELAADSNGALYLLGDQQGVIGRIGKSLKPDERKIRIEKLWSLSSSIHQPEGLVFDDENRPVVTVDRKHWNKPNLFVLAPLKRD